MKRENFYALAQNADEKLLIGKLLDKAEQAEKYDRLITTAFLDLRQQELFCRLMSTNRQKFILSGGFEGAERRAAIFLPSYWEESDLTEEDLPFSALRIQNKAKKELSHRDYLGSLMSLGIRREMIGDILVSEEQADLFVMKEMTEFLLQNLEKASNVTLAVKPVALNEVTVPQIKMKVMKDTVASLRLDAILTIAFSMSRGNAAEWIRKGTVEVNGLAATKADMAVKEGDRLTLRGKGKAILSFVGGTSKKGRTIVEIQRLI